MDAFQSLRYAKARLMLAQNKNDTVEIAKWQERVDYWQKVLSIQKQRNKAF
jgi:hypothetical protein